MAKKQKTTRKAKVKGRHAETYDRIFREYLNAHSDSKGAIEIPYYKKEEGKPNTYLLKKREKKSIKQIYDANSKARSQVRKNLFISKEGNVFMLKRDNTVVIFRRTPDTKTNKNTYNFCITDNPSETGTTIRDYQLTCLVFGEFTPKAQQILDREGLNAMFTVGSSNNNLDENLVQVHHYIGEQSANPKDIIGMTTVFHKQYLKYLNTESEDIDELINIDEILEDEFLGKPCVYFKSSKNDKIFKGYIGETEENAENKLFFLEYSKYLNGFHSTKKYVDKIAMGSEGSTPQEKIKNAKKRIMSNYKPKENYLSLWLLNACTDPNYCRVKKQER